MKRRAPTKCTLRYLISVDEYKHVTQIKVSLNCDYYKKLLDNTKEIKKEVEEIREKERKWKQSIRFNSMVAAESTTNSDLKIVNHINSPVKP
jgi:hypothetical protein